jgi:hypothetical protein
MHIVRRKRGADFNTIKVEKRGREGSTRKEVGRGGEGRRPDRRRERRRGWGSAFKVWNKKKTAKY